MAIVRLIAINPKYRTVPFFMIPVYDETIRGFRTGQEDLTPEQLKKEPFIVDPIEQYIVSHMQAFDTNRRNDAIFLSMIKYQPLIAKNSSSVVAGKHLFYVEDKESESKEKIISMDLMYEAMSTVRKDMTLQRITDLAIFLSIDVRNNPISVIQERIYNRCSTNPKEVLSFFSEATKNRMFVLKLIHYGIVQRRIDRVTDGELLIGRNLEEAVLFMQDKSHDMLVGKWGNELDRKEGRELPEGKKEKKSNVSDIPDSSKLGNVQENLKPSDDTKKIKTDEQERDELKDILISKGITFHPATGLPKLRLLVEEHKDK